MPRTLRDTYHKIGELLVRRRLAPPEAIDEALALQRSALERHRSAPRLGEILVERKILDRKTIRRILEEQKIGRGEKRLLRIGLHDRGGIAVVTLEGRLDASMEERARRVFERLMNAGFARVAVDGTGLLHLDSQALSALVVYVDEARARGGDVKLFGLSPDARLVLDRLGLTPFLQIFETEKEAARAFDLPIDEYMSRGALAEFVSEETGRVFHLSFCPAAQKIPEEARVYFESKWHAREAGRLPCRRCKP